MAQEVRQWSGEALTGLALSTVGAARAALSSELPPGTWAQPGPMVFPLVLGLLLVVLGISSAWRSVRRRDPAKTTVLVERRAAICALLLLAAAIAFVPLGFVPTALVFTVVLFVMLSGSSWLASAAIGAGVTAAAWLLFVYLLHLQLPAGIFGE